MPIIPVFDMDGVLSDSFPQNLSVILQIADEMGIKGVGKRDVKEAFQTLDYNQIWIDLGFSKDYTDEADKRFISIYRSLPLPKIVPKASEILSNLAKYFSSRIVTHETQSAAESRLSHYEISDHFEKVEALQGDVTCECKSEAFMRISRETSLSSIIYIGNLVSDGEAVAKAREKGARIFFIGMTHEYSFNTPEMLLQFAEENPTFATTASSLNDVSDMLYEF